MQLLTKIYADNWNKFDDQTIDIYNGTAFVGNSGSSKSTLLDAFQVIVNPTRPVFNSAVGEKSKRTAKSYVHGALGEEILRPGNTVCFLAAEFTDSQNKSWVAAVAIEVGPGKDDATSYLYMVISGKLDPKIFRGVEGKRLTRGELKAKIKAKGTSFGTVFETRDDYTSAFANRAGGFLKDRFTDLFTKSISTRAVKDVDDFVRQFILDEKPLKLDSVMSAKATFDRLLLEIKETQRKIESLKEVAKAQADTQRYETLLNRQKVVLGLLGNAIAQNQISRHDGDLASLAARLEIIKSEIETTEESQNQAANLRRETEFQINQSEPGKRYNSLKMQKDEAAKALKTVNQRHMQAMGALQTIWKSLKTAAASVSDAVFKGQLQVVETSLASLSPDSAIESGLPVAIAGAVPAIEAALAMTRRSHFSSEDKLRKLDDEHEATVRKLSTLRSDGARQNSLYPESVTKLLDRIAGKASRPPKILAELLQIPDESWQNAVEGSLKGRKFSIVVHPADYLMALATAKAARKDGIEDVTVIDLAKAAEKGRPARPQSLASKIETSAEFSELRAYIDSVFGGIICCDSEAEMREHNSAVTRDMMSYGSFAAKAEARRHYQIWYIGERARGSQIRSLEALATELQEAAAAARKAKTEEGAKVLVIDAASRACSDFARLFREGVNIASSTDELARIDNDLANLDTSSLMALETEFDRLKRLEEHLRAQIKVLMNEEGTSEAEIKAKKLALETARTALAEAAEKEAAVTAQFPDVAEDAKRYFHERYATASNFNSDLTKKDESLVKSYETSMTQCLDAFRTAAISHNTRFAFTGNAADHKYSGYAEELAKLSDKELIRQEAAFLKAKDEVASEVKEQAFMGIGSGFKLVRESVQRINDGLKDRRFRNERIKISYKVKDGRQEFHSLVESMNSLGKDELIASPTYKENSDAFEHFIELLTREPTGDEESKEQAALLDYRSYFEYDVEIIREGGAKSRLSKLTGLNSGGEAQTYFYVIIAACFSQLYKTNDPTHPRETVRFIPFDEVFSNMDQPRIDACIDVFTEFGLQILTASPLVGCERLAHKMGTTLVFTPVGHDTVDIEPYANYAARALLASAG